MTFTEFFNGNNLIGAFVLGALFGLVLMLLFAVFVRRSIKAEELRKKQKEEGSLKITRSNKLLK